MQGEIFDHVYEGDKPYVFISYSHKDDAAVAKVKQALFDSGVRYWYDNGLHSGDDWNLVIANHLQKAAVCILLLSRAAAESTYVKNELNYAVKYRIPIQPLLLEKFIIPPDIEMMLGRIHTIEYEPGFENKLIQALPENVFYEESVNDGAKENKTSKKTDTQPKKQAKMKSTKAQSRKKRRINPLFIILPAVFTVSLVLGLIGAVYFIKSRLVYIADTEFKKSETYISLEEKTLSSEDIDKLSQLPKLGTLRLVNCKLPDNVELNKIFTCADYELKIDNCGITDFRLAAVDFGSVTLQRLNLDNNGAITDLSGVRKLSGALYELSFNNCSVSDISFMTGFEKITSFSAANNKITTLSPLSDCVKLTVIDVSSNELCDLTGLEKCIRLEKLNAHANKINNVDGLNNCTILKEADLGENRITDISALSKSRENLKKVDLSDNGLTDITALSGASSLTQLLISNNSITSLDPLSGSKELTVLAASHNGIADLSGISSCEKLYSVDLSYNNIESTEKIKLDTVNRVSLDLRNNLIKKLVLPGAVSFNSLYVSGNPLSDLSALNGCKVRDLSFDYNESIDLYALAALENTNYIIYNCPLDKQISTEEILGKYYVSFMSE